MTRTFMGTLLNIASKKYSIHIMDYKKSKAPTNTVTHNLMDLAEDTGNLYESLVIIAKRCQSNFGTNERGPQQKNSKSLPLATTTSKRLSRIVNKLKSHVTTNVSPRRH